MQKPDPSIDFFMTLKATDYPDRSLSSAQPRYITVWYRLICIVLHFISRLPPLHSFFLVPHSMVFGLYSPEMNDEFVISKPITDIRKIFVEFLLDFFYIHVLVN